MSTITTPAASHKSRARHHAAAIVDEANDLAAFLAATELPPGLEMEASFILDGVRQILAALTAKIEAQRPDDVTILSASTMWLGLPHDPN